MTTAESPDPARRTTIRIVVAAVAVVIVGTWLLYVAVSHLFVTEGSVPPASFGTELPAGATVRSSEKDCASGGCWLVVNIDPPEGRSARQLAADMGIEEERCTLSPTLNLLSVCVTPMFGPAQDSPNAPLLVHLRYWSPVGSSL
ncbi:hypothetical protein MUN74_10845 [Agromyces endophyticus]|uniref:hypothetical protein n=1 Tax=Agromyces sp. H17E-10 TaxID=2932244 RepID=UPI001FD1CF3C|nr:hypothetical protein [Agromyces sp. H17E-10]UOQ87800.1 hypothetical protein MUN74_10845 [Agromyces sp. H17E-10]